MKRCLLLAVLISGVFGISAEVSADDLVDAFGIIQGIIAEKSDSSGLGRTLLTAYHSGSDSVIVTDTTDSDGRYTLIIPLGDLNSAVVDVHVERSAYNPEFENGIVVEFLVIYTLNFYLNREYGPIYGYVKDSVFDAPIESVYVAVVDDATKFTHTNSNGAYWLTVRDSSDVGYDVVFQHDDFEDQTVSGVIVAIGPYPLDMILERENWYVAMNGNNSWHGGRGDPLRTIQKGVEYATDDDTVYVAPDTMTGPGNVNVGLTDKKIIISSMVGFGSDSTIIDCQGDTSSNESRQAFIIQNDRGSKIKGFTIMNGFSVADGGAINCSSGGSTFIEDCVFKDNYSRSSGGAIASQVNYTEARITDCVFYDNAANEQGGAIYAFFTGRVILYDCTLTKNKANAGGAGISIFASNYDSLTNCIIWDNSPDQINVSFSTFFGVSHCVVEGGWEGDPIYDISPLFCDAYEDDFQIAANSICCGNGVVGDTIGALGVDCDSAGVIFGTVIEIVVEEDRPLGGVTVTATSSQDTVRQDETDSDGKYEIVIPDAVVDDFAYVKFEKPMYDTLAVPDFPFDVDSFAQLDTVMEKNVCGNYVIGDFNANGTFNIADVIAAFSKLKTGEPEPGMVCECPIASGTEWAVAIDVNNSCTFNIADVIAAFAKLKTGLPELIPCEDCPPSG